MQIERYRLTVKETHLDFMGHMNNATYLEIFADARWDVITHRGYGIDQIRATGQGPVILGVELKFLKELRLRESFEVTTELLEYRSKTGKLLQKMIKSDGTVAAEAIFTFGLFDVKLRKLVDATPEWRKGLGLS